jgi:excisionase family DNA binding protein
MLKTWAGDVIGTFGPEAYGIASFCIAHNISRSTFYNLVKDGKAPRLMRVGTRVLISREAAKAWRREREKVAL